MSARLIDLPYSELHPTIRALSEAGADEDLARLLRQPDNAALAVAVMRRALTEPEIVSVRELTEIQIWSWVKFYRELFDLDASVAQMPIPAFKSGFDRLIVVPQGMTLQKVKDVCLRFFMVNTRDECASEKENERNSQTSGYIVRVRNCREIANDFSDDITAEEIRTRGLVTTTLLEMVLFHLKVFVDTGSHLDREEATLCSGSRFLNSRGVMQVPYLYWEKSKDRLEIVLCGLGLNGPYFYKRAYPREVVAAD